MDVFFEQIVTVKKSTGRVALQIFIPLLMVAMVVAGILLALFGGTVVGAFSVLGLPVAMGAGYGGYWLMTSQNIEYEYAITNGEFDLDKIIAQRRRKRVLSVECKEIEAFGKYNPEEHAHRSYEQRIVAGNAYGERWYAVMRVKEKGQVLLIFEPNEKILGAFKKFLPKPVAREAFKN